MAILKHSFSIEFPERDYQVKYGKTNPEDITRIHVNLISYCIIYYYYTGYTEMTLAKLLMSLIYEVANKCIKLADTGSSSRKAWI